MRISNVKINIGACDIELNDEDIIKYLYDKLCDGTGLEKVGYTIEEPSGYVLYINCYGVQERFPLLNFDDNQLELFELIRKLRKVFKQMNKASLES